MFNGFTINLNYYTTKIPDDATTRINNAGPSIYAMIGTQIVKLYGILYDTTKKQITNIEQRRGMYGVQDGIYISIHRIMNFTLQIIEESIDNDC